MWMTINQNRERAVTSIVVKREISTLTHCGQNVKRYSCCENQYGGCSEKLNMELPCDPETPLLGVRPKELTAETQADTGAPMTRAALFTAANMQE